MNSSNLWGVKLFKQVLNAVNWGKCGSDMQTWSGGNWTISGIGNQPLTPITVLMFSRRIEVSHLDFNILTKQDIMINCLRLSYDIWLYLVSAYYLRVSNNLFIYVLITIPAYVSPIAGHRPPISMGGLGSQIPRGPNANWELQRHRWILRRFVQLPPRCFTFVHEFRKT